METFGGEAPIVGQEKSAKKASDLSKSKRGKSEKRRPKTAARVGKSQDPTVGPAPTDESMVQPKTTSMSLIR